MTEYIEREVVLKWFEPYLGGGETWVEIHPVLDAIHTFPAADVAPVRHGRWLGERGGYTCNVCGCEGPEDGGYWASPFCPNCGAKMDLEGGDGDGR